VTARPGYGADLRDLRTLLKDEKDPIARMATICALLMGRHAVISWVGFYRLVEDVLILGPFQGPIACLRIRVGEGVCGTVAARREALVVPDVHEFPGHIACDPNSRSEVVLPVFGANGDLKAVLDVDSRQPAAFSEADRDGLLPIAQLALPPADEK
jgi:GAF domain-containing protein